MSPAEERKETYVAGIRMAQGDVRDPMSLPEPYILCNGETDGRFQIGEGLTKRRSHLLLRGLEVSKRRNRLGCGYWS